jgi:hypothetical protein
VAARRKSIFSLEKKVRKKEKEATEAVQGKIGRRRIGKIRERKRKEAEVIALVTIVIRIIKKSIQKNKS